MLSKRLQLSTSVLVAFSLILVSIISSVWTAARDHKREHQQKGDPCIARFESTGEPLYYSCPRPNESEKKSYCCYLDKCCDYKEYQKQTEQQFKLSNSLHSGHIPKGAIGNALKVLLWIVLFVIVFIVGCCCLTFLLCRKKKLFQGGIFKTPLPAQPPGPSPYAPPSNPYMAYQWPPETAPVSPPAYPAYPPYPALNLGPRQPPLNPNFK